MRYFICYLSVSIHYFLLRLRVYGNNNLSIDKRVLLWKSKLIVKGKNNTIKLCSNVKLDHTTIEIKGHNNSIVLHEGVKIYESCEILIEGNDCEIHIGSKTTIGSAHIYCGESGTSITIGDDCMLSRQVFINTSDFHSIIDLNSSLRINPPQSIVIGIMCG